MRRLRRILINALTILSLLLCVGTSVLWGRSHFNRDIFGYAFGPGFNRSVSLASQRAQISISYSWGTTGYYPGGLSWATDEWPYAEFSPSWRRFGIESPVRRSGYSYRQAYLPHWSLAVLFGVLPTIYLLRKIRSRRLKRIGHCPTCGYDLRATPDRCPECGTVPKKILISN